MAGSHDRFRTPTELVVAALIVAGTLPIARLFRSSVVPTILGAIVVSGFTAWGLRRTRLYAPVAALVSAVAWFWYAGLLYHRDAMLGPLPTPAMVGDIGAAIAEGIRTATTEDAPVLGTTALLTLVSMIVWGVTWLADDAVHKLRHPLLAIGFVLPLFVFPGTLLDSSHHWLDAGLFIAASLAVLFSDESSRLARWGRTAGFGSPGWKPGLAARIGTLVIVVAVTVAPVLPGYGVQPGEGPGGSGGGGDRVALNPLVSIKPRLSRDPATALFTVRSPVPSYWRLTSLDQFNGFVWTAPPRQATRVISGKRIAPTVDTSGRDVKQTYTIERLAGPWLPGAFEPLSVGKRGNVRLEPVSRSLVLGDQLRPSQQFTVTSRFVSPTAEVLDGVPAESMTESPSLAPFLEYDQRQIPADVVRLAVRLTEDEPTPFRKALALQRYLRGFRYNENVAEGHSYDNLAAFLEAREGYCEQFAGSMAVLARVVGLPSRVAIGFTTGDFKGGDLYEVTSRHAHAWVEIFFPGFGWLTFEPTPRGDSTTIVPSYTQSRSSPPTLTPTTEPTASAEPTARPTETRNPQQLEDAEGDAAGAAGGRKVRNLLLWAVPAGLLGVAAIALPGAARLKRARRRRKARSPRELAATHYLDFLDWCATAGFPRGRGETPAEYARRLADAAAPAEGPLRSLAEAATQVLWAPDGSMPATDRLGREAQRAMAGALPRRARLLAASGWGWWRG